MGAGNDRIISTGIPLVDVSRIARYDILVPPLGLGAWWFWLRARSTGRNRHDFLAGLLAGMAGLAHYYGLFWIVALLLLLLLERFYFTHQPTFRSHRPDNGWSISPMADLDLRNSFQLG